MKSELLLRIKDAESAANQRVEDAKAEAKTVLTDARREAEAVVAQGRQEADAAYQQHLAATRKQAEDAAAKVIAEGATKAEALRASFEDSVRGVSDRVLQIFEERLA